MRRIGTTTSAIGFIFLGIWIMINSYNADLGSKLLKWWPLIIIFIGIEILYYVLVKKEKEKLRINGLVFLVIIIFFFTNTFNGIFYDSRKSSFSLNFNKSLFDNFFTNKDLKSVNKKLTLEPIGTSLNFETSNGKIYLEKASDNNITIDSTIYLKQGADLNDYELNPIKESNGYSLKITDDNIDSINTTIYLPQDYSMSIIGPNFNVDSSNDIKLNALNINASNGKMDLEGDISNSLIKMANGKVDLNNKLCKNIDISLNNGTCTLNTKDNNLSINTDINHGECKINNEKRINSGISKKIGTGEDIVKVKLNNGSIKINSGE